MNMTAKKDVCRDKIFPHYRIRSHVHSHGQCRFRQGSSKAAVPGENELGEQRFG